MFRSLLSARVRNTVWAERGTIPQRGSCKHDQAQALRHQWTRDVNGTEIPHKIKFNVFDVKSPLLSTSKLRKHGYPVLLDQQQTIQKNGTTIALTDQNGFSTLELRLASRAGKVDEKMCAPVEEIGETSSRNPPHAVQILVKTLRERKRKRKSSPQPLRVG